MADLRVRDTDQLQQLSVYSSIEGFCMPSGETRGAGLTAGL